MKKKLIPMNDRVLIKPIQEGEQRHGNIIIPDLGKERPEMGEVIAVGPGRTTEFGTFLDVKTKVGSIVLVPKIGAIRFDLDGEEYYIAPDREILVTIEEGEDE